MAGLFPGPQISWKRVRYKRVEVSMKVRCGMWGLWVREGEEASKGEGATRAKAFMIRGKLLTRPLRFVTTIAALCHIQHFAKESDRLSEPPIESITTRSSSRESSRALGLFFGISSPPHPQVLSFPFLLGDPSTSIASAFFVSECDRIGLVR